MKKSTSVAAPLLASVALALVASQSVTAEPVRVNERRLTSVAMVLVQAQPVSAADQSTTERGGFGTWFIVPTIVGVAIVFGAGG